MAKFDRYMLSQLLVLFGFFSLVLVAVFWINRAVVLFDRLIGDGQTALVFLEFSALGMPKLISTVLPLSTFSAAVYVTNRLNNESELTVVQAAGSGPFRLARPILVFGMISALMMSILVNILVPAAQAQLSERESEIKQNVTARLLTEGVFLHPASGVTFYTGSIAPDGVLQDVFMADRRNPEERVLYTSDEAYLVQNGDGTSLIMVNGLVQRLTVQGLRLITTKFQDFSFDISTLVNKSTVSSASIRNMSSFALLVNWNDITAQTGARIGYITEELHSRFAQSLFCIVAAMIGFATLLLGTFSRFGVWREIVVAFAILIFLDGLRSTFVDLVLTDETLWPVLYIPVVIGSFLCVAMLWHASNPSWWRKGVRV
ncbi:LPS export ABC transporter permease LptF [Ascidiaceihabitans sp.]|nr:LPS export ABC transporter permease LptF [Ascidiaceihabitans sp.]